VIKGLPGADDVVIKEDALKVSEARLIVNLFYEILVHNHLMEIIQHSEACKFIPTFNAVALKIDVPLILEMFFINCIFTTYLFAVVPN